MDGHLRPTVLGRLGGVDLIIGGSWHEYEQPTNESPISWFDLRAGGKLVLRLHSTNEPGELLR